MALIYHSTIKAVQRSTITQVKPATLNNTQSQHTHVHSLPILPLIPLPHALILPTPTPIRLPIALTPLGNTANPSADPLTPILPHQRLRVLIVTIRRKVNIRDLCIVIVALVASQAERGYR